MSHLEKLLLIVNPAACNGTAGQAAERAAAALCARLGQGAVTVAHTAGPRHAIELAANAAGCTAIVALGGDGVIHEVANGLMARPAHERPAFGIVPVGSGNDYARAIGVPTDVDAACALLCESRPRPTDVGRVNGHCFVETLSFGVDAAIALDTVERRARTGRTGTVLYVEAGIDQLTHHLVARPYRAVFNEAAPEGGQSITFAVQVGPYYGGGFKICPEASFDDGQLDVCISHPPVGVARALGIFALAKGGRHVGLKQVELRRCGALRVEFDEPPPAQMDGERIEATAFDVVAMPAALRVMRP